MPRKKLTLEDYPQAIADFELSLLKIQQEIDTAQRKINRLDADIEYVVAHDTELRNDAQRKAAKAALQLEHHYLSAAKELQQARAKQSESQIKVGLLRNQFCVAKLQMKYEIAQMEVAAA